MFSKYSSEIIIARKHLNYFNKPYLNGFWIKLPKNLAVPFCFFMFLPGYNVAFFVATVFFRYLPKVQFLC